MRNKILSKSVIARVFRKTAFVLALAVALSGTAALSAAATPTISGESTVRADVCNVLIPMNLNFEINPFGEGKITPTSQITSTDYPIVNKTHFPVIVDFDITATLGSSVTLVDDPVADLSVNNNTDTTKKIYFAILGAKSFSGTAKFSDTVLPSGGFTYDAVAKAKSLIPFLSTTTPHKAKISFLLGAATNNGAVGTVATVNTLAASNKGIGSFQFFARMNTYANWAANDVKVEAAYTFTQVHPSTYETYKSQIAANTLNQLVLTP